MNIHFICRGNVLRSLIAETYVKSLGLEGVHVTSSGTNVNWSDETEKAYFANTLKLLKKHGIQAYAKAFPEQLTPERANHQDLTICLNQRVMDEAVQLVTFPGRAINWDIVDIGEGARADKTHRLAYEEEIYNEITAGVDKLIQQGTIAPLR
jgi:protein-tyrosine-phosphatase